METLSLTELAVRVLIACVGGMVIGIEREWREKAAGFRTITLVSLGSAAFVLGAQTLTDEATGRAIAGVATGVGFLGAGAILRERRDVFGLTTAAAVWLAAAIGAAAGMGAYELTALGVLAALVVLVVLPRIDVSNLQQDLRTYEIHYGGQPWQPQERSAALSQAGLAFTMTSLCVTHDDLAVTWRVVGRASRHEKAIELLTADPTVTRFEVA